MATVNYGWQQPNKDGIQREEVDRIAAAFAEADATVKSIDDAVAALDAALAALNAAYDAHTHSFAQITDKPTTVAGFGITDAYTKSEIDNKVAADIDAAVNGLINGSPGALDTLQELAAAMGDDPDFATTVTNQIATKLAKASNLSDLPNKATARANLGANDAGNLTVGTVADARLPGSMSGKTFTTTTDFASGGQSARLAYNSGGANPYFGFYQGGTARFGYIQAHSTVGMRIYVDGGAYMDVTQTAGLVTISGHKVWHEGNDGAGSGLDADLLDGYNLSFSDDGSSVAARNSSGDIYARLFRSTYADTSATISALIGRNGSGSFHFPVTLASVAEQLASHLTYTGSSRDQTVFPVGHCIAGYGASARTRNGSYSVRHRDTYSYDIGHGSGAACSGTWRVRGESGEPYYFVAQRTA